MTNLAGKSITVTGAAGGMGEGHVRLLHSPGAKIAFTDLDTARGRAVAKSIGKNTLFPEQDVTSEYSWAEVVRAANENFGPVYGLVNNAGIALRTPFETVTTEQFEQHMAALKRAGRKLRNCLDVVGSGEIFRHHTDKR